MATNPPPPDSPRPGAPPSSSPHPSPSPVHRHYAGEDGPEIPMPSGDVTEGVVRAGSTVRRPHQPQSAAVAGYLDHLERAGFDGSPRYLGRDVAGRDVLTYLAGDVPGDPPEEWAATEEVLSSVGDLLRRLHEASAGYSPPSGSVWRRDLLPVAPTGSPGPSGRPCPTWGSPGRIWPGSGCEPPRSISGAAGGGCGRRAWATSSAGGRPG